MSFLGKIGRRGITFGDTKSEKGSIMMSNYLSLLSAAVPVMLIAYRLIQGTMSFNSYATLTISFFFVFLLPVVLNGYGLKHISRTLVCWLPSLYILFLMINGLREASQFHEDYYVAPRLYLLAFCSFPYLVYDLKNTQRLALALSVPLIILFLFDRILEFIGLGYHQVGLNDVGYESYQIRVLIAFLIISASTVFLRLLAEQRENANEKLLSELAEKNEVIKRHAESEVLQLNRQLRANLQELNEREFLLNQSQRIAKIGSWEYRVEDGFLFWSDEMYSIFGLDKSYNIKSSNMEEALGEEAGKTISQATAQLLRTGRSYDLTFRTKTPLGYYKWFRVYAFAILEDGNTIGVRGICHDITFFKEAEEQLRSSEAKFARTFENNPDLIMLVREQDLMVVDANQKIFPVLGYHKSEVMGTSARSLNLFLTEEGRQDFTQGYDENGQIKFECPFKRKDGRVIHVSITATRIIIEGQYYRMSVIQDITDRKAAEEKFLKAFSLSPDLMLVIRERDFKIIEANEKIQEILRYTRSVVIGISTEEKQFDIWVHPEERVSFYQEYNARESVFREVQLKKKNGEVFFATISAKRILLSGENHMLTVIRDITERRKSEEEKERARYLLNERIKELTTLYKTSQLLNTERKSIAEVFQDVVSVLPSGWQFSDISAARIVLDGKEFKTANCSAGVHKQTAEFHTPFGSQGIVEVIYLEQRPNEWEGPFFEEERNLINLVAEMLRIYLTRVHSEEALNESEANLMSTINNTETLIWSVDRNYQLLTFNKPFFNYIRTNFHTEVKTGSRVLASIKSKEKEEGDKKWEQRYLRALMGELVTVEESEFGIDLHYSLSPIIVGTQIIGVSVFANNFTDRNARERELSDAIKKIGELKLMALRSVMSPHFVFNVLNSIQYFIAKNDRLNAINYLSTFSKLIRSILTHSVDNKIKLSDEVEMLKNYVSLEMVRFENKFEFKLEVDPDTDLDAIEIPSLLIQPYAENAILHGLYNKQTQGTLTIRVAEKDGIVIFEIEDDGIGRAAALKLRKQNFPAHKSMGINLTEERLKLINAQQQTTVNIEDLSNATGPCGTKVTIRIGID